jgi:thymidylate synthase ThyX
MTKEQVERMKRLAAEAETKVADRQEALTLAASDLARTVGPLATAHRLAELALEFADLAETEAGP